MNFTHDPTEAIEGVLWSYRGGWLTLRAVCEALKAGQPPVPIPGDIVDAPIDDRVPAGAPVIVRTFEGLQALTTPAADLVELVAASRLNLYGLNQAYAEIYRTQPNVRICVDFLGRNIAHVGTPGLPPHLGHRPRAPGRPRSRAVAGQAQPRRPAAIG